MNYLSDKDLVEFFENAGFETAIMAVEEHFPSYHGKVETMVIDKAHVVINGTYHRADEVYQQVMCRRMVVPDPTTIAIVNEILNND
ncbi:hypothetical protein [uncultured Draconibacterium sp.]|uniref:hypothetical protein n=1 Tax=uncultured Draconibacterium sp. TaxID=1573823 RepID=UPI0025F6A8DE|nr:hypothetical protein [uncultured Draconibacterium sp.]